MVNFKFLKISIFLLEEGWFLFLKETNENTILFVEKIERDLNFVVDPDFALDSSEITVGPKFAIGSNVVIFKGSWNEKTVAIKFFNLHAIEKEMKPLIEKEIQILHYLK